MRGRLFRSMLVVAGIAAVAMTACVPSAKPLTKDTIAPLGLPLVTSTSAVPSYVTLITAATGTAVPANVDPTVVTSPPASTVPAATSTSSGATTIPAAASDPNTHTYTVATKDTLYGIARKCSISAQALADYNGWGDGLTHPIFPGSVIKVPCDVANAPTTTASSSSGVTTTTTAPAESTTTIAVATVLYTIVAGDYLSSIAAKNATTIQAIVSVNGWKDGANHLIIVGQQIKVPAKAG